MRTLVIVLVCLLAMPVFAIGVDEDMLADPAQEQRARELMEDLRCLVCQNQTVEESNADMARDIRMIVRERIAAGDTNEEVHQYMVDRYGDWILMKPPFKAETLLLWLGPILLILGGGLGVWIYVRRQGRATATPLSDEERARLDTLLGDDPPAP